MLGVTMNLPTISAVAMATTAFVVGTWHLILFLQAREQRVNLTYGLCCLSLGAYDLLCAGLYQAQSVPEGMRWQTLQSFALVAAGITFLWFAVDYAAVRKRLVPALLTIAYMPIAYVAVSGRHDLLWSSTPLVKHIELPWGYVIVYHEVAPGPLTNYQTLLGTVVFGYVFVAGARMLRQGQRARGLPLLLATAIFFAGMLNDSAVAAGLYQFIYVVEYSFLSLVLLMAYPFTAELLRARSLSMELVKSEERYRQFVEGTGDLVTQISGDGRLLFANHAASRMLGVRPEDCPGLMAMDFVHPDDRDRTLRAVLDCIRDGDAHATIENRLCSRSGEEREMLWTIHLVHDSSGRLVSASAMGRDITRRKLTEKALRESEQAYQALVESSLQAVAVFEGTRYLFVNVRMTELYGWSREEFLSMSAEQAQEIIHPDDRDMVLRRRIARQGGLREQAVYEFRIRRKDGETRWVQVFANAITYRGRPCSLAVYVDSTDRHEAESARARAEEERARLEVQLRHAQKMQAVGQLAGGVAHDFNNLLQAIVGYTELARRALDPDAAPRKHLDQVMAAADRASSLTRQLLTFSRSETIQRRVVQMHDLIADLMKMLRRVLGEQIELALFAQPDVGHVHIDPGQVEQVLMNLCINARDAMPSGGRITIETTRVRLDDRFCGEHPWASPADYVVVSVSDTGVGIPADILDRIFEPFFTTKEVGRGTGLGLATVYAIIERHGGGITVESQEGRGATFRVYLPASDALGPERTAEPVLPAVRGGNETILVAEDDEIVRTLATTVLRQAGYRLFVASDGDEAIGIIRAQGERIDLAVIDVVMPGKGGLEVRDAIAALRAPILVLFSTGYAPEVEQRCDPATSADRVLMKPYQPADLLRKVRELLDGRPSRA